MTRRRRRAGLLALMLGWAVAVQAQEGTTIPPEYRGTEDAVARGVLNGNLIETNYRNHGEMARWNDMPWGVWPKTIGGRHIDGVGVVVAGLVRGERAKWSRAPYNFWPAGTPDTLLNPVSIHYRSAGTKVNPADGRVWGWLPLPGFHNPFRRDPITGQRQPVPALSTDPASWPSFWPDKLSEPDDPGWAGRWNGMFGKGVFNADQESFYVMDDLADGEYLIDPVTRRPNSAYGIYYPDPADSTRGGIGLQVGVRLLQWGNILAEDVMFMIYRITNLGQTRFGEVLADVPGQPRTGLYFTQVVDYGLGNEETDESAAFNPQIDVAYGWDHDGIGQHMTGGTYRLGYTGFAFLESPANDHDALDNDEDGIRDEGRFGGPGVLIEGQDAIRAYVEANYDLALFEQHYGPLEQRPAYRAGRWWTGDEDLDWIGFDDANNNGLCDPGELVNDDVGRDGQHPFDLDYSGPDTGECDGIPTPGEPNFDQLDVDESDQIGLTGFHLGTRPFYEAGDNLRDDTWMWARIRESQFALGQEPRQLVANVEPFLNFSSGPVELGPNETDFFSLGWIFGEDEQDFFKNRQTVQQIYNADYRFAQPPIMPTLKAEAGDGYVVLSWDTLALASFDRFTQQFDFEGFKLYKGTDPLLSDARVITNASGIPTFYKPLAQWDLVNEHAGNVPVLENTAFYNLGSNTGLQFSYIDRDVINGKTYYYALVAYDHGFTPEPDSLNPDPQPIDPQENTFSVNVDQAGNIRGHTPNVAIVTPRARAAGYVPASTNEDLSRPTEGIGTGRIEVTVVNSAEIDPDVVYRLVFSDTTEGTGDTYRTTHYALWNATTNEVLLPRTPLVESPQNTVAVDGFVITIHNDERAVDWNRTGWVGHASEEELFSRNPRQLPGYQTNWTVAIEEDQTNFGVPAPHEYEIWWADSLYTTPNRPYPGHLRRVQIPVWCRNVSTGAPCELLVRDLNENGAVDLPGDALVLAEVRFNVHRFRYVLTFSAAGAESIAPAPGNRIRISTFRPFSRNDYFQFTMRPGHVDEDLARQELDKIAVVPNPYIAAAEWEPRTQIQGRGPRRIQFIHLPERCTIRIFNVRGELVRRLHHEGTGGDGVAWWDLLTEDGQEVAYGIYLYHVEAPGIGEKVGKFAIVK
ncbi:hypothetical protein GQ464_011225 [Rhodocaloribacter litoris]|uniref:hypothetical protein n=1 Tax=Rhodocaloribacter litoris TaxID=2558931 RepID=UPI00142324C0|nr:hypothetical protein [Rhodocaloribacter litoris]QXD14029.1 hypothetical protein GQ464_011225 [Rhodocaloribacter litoris]